RILEHPAVGPVADRLAIHGREVDHALAEHAMRVVVVEHDAVHAPGVGGHATLESAVDAGIREASDRDIPKYDVLNIALGLNSIDSGGNVASVERDVQNTLLAGDRRISAIRLVEEPDGRNTREGGQGLDLDIGLVEARGRRS